MNTSARSNLEQYYEHSYAIIIGISQYKEEGSLINAANDANAIKKVLEEKYGFNTIVSLFDEDATADNIRGVFYDTLQDTDKIGPDDRVLIYYSGHGKLRRTYGRSGEERREGYIVPYDSRKTKYGSNVSMKTIIDACQNCPAKHVLLILDCCYSGYAATRTGDEPTKPPRPVENYIKDISSRTAIQVFAAGQEDEPVSDSGIRPGFSAFTGALLDILETEIDPDSNGILTASEIGLNLERQVALQEQRGTFQRPVYTHVSGSSGGDFIFRIFDTTPAQKYQSANSDSTREGKQNIFYRKSLKSFIQKPTKPFLSKRKIVIPILAVSGIGAIILALYASGILFKPIMNGEQTPTTVSDKAPIASVSSSADGNVANEGEIVNLYGNKSKDPEGGRLQYMWMQLPMSTIALSNCCVANPSFMAPEVDHETNFTFQLQVRDEGNRNANATIQILVQPKEASVTSFPSPDDPLFRVSFEYPSDWIKEVENNTVNLSPPISNEVPALDLSSSMLDTVFPTYFALTTDNKSSNESLDSYASQFRDKIIPNYAEERDMSFHIINSTKDTLSISLDTIPAEKIFFNLTNTAGMTQQNMITLIATDDKLYTLHYSASPYYYNLYLPVIQNIISSLNLSYAPRI